MSMLWVSSLYLLILIPLAVIAYVWIMRRRRRFVIRYSSLSLVREAAAHQSQWRRHAPFILFLLALTSLILASTRPTAEIRRPIQPRHDHPRARYFSKHVFDGYFSESLDRRARSRD